MTAAPITARSGNGSSFTPLHEVPRFDLYCRADAIGNRSLVQVPRLLAAAFRLPWPVAVTAQAWDDVVGRPQAGSALAQQLTLGVLAARDRDGFHRSTRAKNTDHGHS